MEISMIGLDLAKNVFAVHGIEAGGGVVLRREIRRSQMLAFFAKQKPCVVGMEASSGAHYWARELGALGHEIRLMPASYVKAYVKRGKTDAADAAAICEAMTRPTMRFVPVKSVEQQAVLALHRCRDLMVKQRTQTSNALRSMCAEFGIVAAKGRMPLTQLFALIGDEADGRLPALARASLTPLIAQHELLCRNIAALERQIASKRTREEARLMTIPGVGPLIASAVVASIGNVERFATGRDFAAWIGLTPKANSSGGKHKQGAISKQGDRYLRKLLVQGATSLLRCAPTAKTPIAAWARELLARKPKKVVALALANKLSRIAWALLAKGGTYGHALKAEKLAA
jgi:transposase